MAGLVQKVAAQAGPTFPYDGPFDQPGPTPPDEQVVVRLSTDSSILNVGSTTTCNLSVESSSQEIQSYTLVVNFDATVLEVVDANSTQVGVQVDFLDTLSSEQQNEADNANGTVTLRATVSGAAQTVNKSVAEITFRAKSAGTSVVNINKADSSVSNEQGTDILGTTTSLNFTVSGQAITTTSTVSTTSVEGDLPPSGIFNTLATLGSVISGFVLLFVGARTIIDRQRGKEIDI